MVLLRRLLCLAAVTLLPQPDVHALDNGVGARPPLGWSSWNHFNSNINANILKEAADAMATNGLLDAGYEYINLGELYRSLPGRRALPYDV